MKKIFSYGFGSIAQGVIYFFTLPFLTRVISPENYGIGSLYAITISILFFLTSFGLDQVYVRFYFEENNERLRSALLFTCILTSLCSTFILGGFIFLFYNKTLLLIFGSSSPLLYFSIIFGCIFFSLNRFLLLALRMQQKAFQYSLNQVILSITYAISILFLYYKFGISNFWLIIFSKIISLTISSVFLMLQSWNLFFSVFDAKERLLFRNIKQKISYGYPFVFSFILSWGMQNIDRYYILHYSDATALGLYSAAYSLVSPVTMLQSIFLTFWVPYANKILIQEIDRARKVFVKIFDFISYFSFLCIVLLICFKSFIVWFVGESYKDSIPIMFFLLFVPYFYLCSEIANAGIILSKKSNLNVVVSFIAFSLNLVFCFVFVPKYGAIGAAASTALAYAAFFISRHLFSNKYFYLKIIHARFIILNVLILSCIIFSNFSTKLLYSMTVFSVFLSIILYRNTIKILFNKKTDFCGN